jgi:hypothetical protein
MISGFSRAVLSTLPTRTHLQIRVFELKKTTMVKEWSKIQKDACNYYVGGKSLSEVCEIMARDHNFEAWYVRLPSHSFDSWLISLAG